MNVLIVDDEVLIIRGIKQMLLDSQIKLREIYTATSAPEALTLFKEHQPEIIVTDIRMPSMSGLDLIREMKQTPIPFKSLIISSYDDFQYAKEGILLGIENYLIKPINQNELLRSLEEIIRKISNERLHKELWTVNETDIFKDNFLRRLLTNKISQDELDNWQELLLPYNYWNDFTILTFKWGSQFSMQHKQDLLQTLKKISLKNEIINISAAEISLLIETTSTALADLETCLSGEKYFKHLFVTQGPSVDKIHNIAHSYENAKNLQAYSLVFGFGHFISEQDIRRGNQLAEHISQEELADLIHQFNLSGIHQKFAILKNDMLAVQLSPTEIQNTGIQIGLILNRIKGDLGMATANEVTTLRSLMEKIAKQQTATAIFDYLLSEAAQLIHDLRQAASTYSPITQRILRIVEEDLSVHHSLKTLAEQLNMNSAYLGQLFQKEIGCNFNQYCHHLRLKQANSKIIQSDLSISQIAKELGYEDISYFYRLYKKDFGCTPNKVRANRLSSASTDSNNF